MIIFLSIEMAVLSIAWLIITIFLNKRLTLLNKSYAKLLETNIQYELRIKQLEGQLSNAPMATPSGQFKFSY